MFVYRSGDTIRALDVDGQSLVIPAPLSTGVRRIVPGHNRVWVLQGEVLTPLVHVEDRLVVDEEDGRESLAVDARELLLITSDARQVASAEIGIGFDNVFGGSTMRFEDIYGGVPIALAMSAGDSNQLRGTLALRRPAGVVTLQLGFPHPDACGF